MNAAGVVDRLAALPIFAEVPRAELEWLAQRGRLRDCPAGTILMDDGSSSDEMHVMLGGRAAVYVNRGASWRKTTEARAGEVLGAVPYSRMQVAPGRLVVEDDAEIFTLHRSHFTDLQRECHALTAALVHGMIDRTRAYQMALLQEDRLQSLGRLAAGLAHELNNPASAAMRSARSLAGFLDAAEEGARTLLEAQLTAAQLAALDAMRAASAAASSRGAIELADREDAFAEWLQRHGISSVDTEVLASSTVRLDDLTRLAADLPPPALGAAIRWVASGRAARAIAGEVARATGRIHGLVEVVKRFTLMDRELIPGDVDIAQGLSDTLTVLANKSKTLAVEVRLETPPDLPLVFGFASEINQVWEKLIDNAIDAAGRNGHVAISAASRGENVVVTVADDGLGIPEKYRPRVFEPFFTTKPIGQAAGLGLHLARRIVLFHRGDIDFTSEAGRTIFRVRLPVDASVSSSAASP